MSPAGDRVFRVRNVVLLAGVLVATVGTIYFATELPARLSEAGRVAGLILLGLVYGGLGFHFQEREGEDVLVEKQGWRWLRVANVFYALGLLSAFTAVIVFLSIDGLDRLVKAGVVLAVGLALILAAARRLDERRGPDLGEEEA
jgi:MFS family permease